MWQPRHTPTTGPQPRQQLQRAGAWLGAILLCLILMPASLRAQTAPEAGFLEGLVQSALSSEGREVQITGLTGALSSRASIAEITLADQGGVWLRLVGIELNWSRLALLRRRLEVNRLTIESAEVLRAPLPAAADAADADAAAPPPGPRALPGPEALPDLLAEALDGALGAGSALPDLPTAATGPGLRLPELPLAVTIAEARVARLSLAASLMGADANGPPVLLALAGQADLIRGEGAVDLSARRIDEVTGSAHLRASFANATGRLRLDLGLDEPAGGIVATALGLPDQPALRLALTGAGPVGDFAAQLTLSSDGVQRIGGDLRLQGLADSAETRFQAQLAGDPTPLLDSQHRAFFGPGTRLDLHGRRAATGALELQTLLLQTAQLRLQGQAALAPGGVPRRLDLTVAIAAPEGATRPVRLPLPGPPTQITQARLSLGYDAAKGDEGWRLAGRIDGIEAPGMRLRTLDLTGSGRIEPQPAGGLHSLGGTLRLTAQGIAPADPDLAAALGPALTAETLLFWSDTAPATLNLRRLKVTGADYGLTGLITLAAGTDTLAPAGDLDILAEARLTAADLSRFAALAGRPDLAGAGQIDWAGRIAPVSGGFDGQARIQGRDLALGIAEADRLLSGQSDLRADARRDATGILLRTLDLRAEAGLEAQLSGRIAPGAADLQGRVALPDLSVLGPGYGGELRLQGQISHADGRDSLALRGTGAGLAVQTGLPELDGLLAGQAEIEIEASRADRRIDVARLQIAAGPLRISGAGQIGGGASDLMLDGTLTDLSALGRGRAGRLDLQARIEGPPEAERITLNARANDLITAEGRADALLAGRSDLALRALRAPGLIRIEALDLAAPGLSLRGSGRWQAGASALEMTARIPDLGVLVPEIPGPLDLTGTLREAGSDAAVDIRATGPAGLDLRILGALAQDGSRAALALTGRFDALLANVLIAPVALRGPVVADLRLDGPLALTAVSGSLRPEGLRAAIPEPPLALEAISGRVDLAAGRANIALATRPQAGGSLAIDGTLGLAAPFPADLRLDFRNAAFRDPQLYQTDVTGTVRLTGPMDGGGAIGGTLRLGETNLRIATTGAGGFGALPGLTHENAPAAVQTTLARAGLTTDGPAPVIGLARPFALDLTIEAPRRIFVRGRGLDAEIGGQVRVLGTTADVLPSGGFTLVRGRLDLLGKRFDLTEGSATMEGRFIPRLNFVARTTTSEGEARIELEGPADAPTIRFVSDPPLPEEEVVARLLFGRDLTTLSPFQAAQLASALASLTGSGGTGVIEALRRGTGLDDLDILTDDTGAAGLRVGKYLSQNLYADAALNPDGTSEVTLNLDVTPTVTARGRLGDAGQTGLGIFYERDY